MIEDIWLSASTSSRSSSRSFHSGRCFFRVSMDLRTSISNGSVPRVSTTWQRSMLRRRSSCEMAALLLALAVLDTVEHLLHFAVASDVLHENHVSGRIGYCELAWRDH